MFLSLLEKHEKYKFLDLAIYMVLVDGGANAAEEKVLNKMKFEMGRELLVYDFSKGEDIDTTIDYFKEKNKVVKNLVLLNLLKLSLCDDLYNIEEHLFIEKVQEAFEIPDKKKNELIKVVYAERDLLEKAKRVINE